MYSGSDSTESANYGQWPLNPTFFQNMPNEQVDWAALAQQWIQMKEAGPPIPESKQVESKKENNEKKERESLPKKIEESAADSSWNNVTTGEPIDNSYWKAQPNWDWNNAWNPQISNPQVVPPLPKSTLLPTPKSYTSVDTSNDTNISLNPGYQTSRSNDFSSGFSGHSANHSRQYKPHNRRYSKVNVPKSVTAIPPVNIPSTSDVETCNLDASKRKQLPAWIREGLEKMERDKLKQMEKEKEKEKQNIYTEKIKEQEKEAMEILKDTIKERRRSKFDSDEERSPKRTERSKEEPAPLTHDELMLLVRRTMTEILLKVTNEAIQSICTEERQRYVKKFQTLGRNSGKANVRAKLGLGMYGSDSGSESDDSEVSKKDSDDDLKNVIKKKKAEFIQTEKGIEDKLFQAEQQKGNSKVADEEENSSDNQPEESILETKRNDDSNSKNKSYSNTKQSRESTNSSEESDRDSSRRKSSSRSRESSVSTKRKNRSRSRDRDRGYTPEKRKRHRSPRRSRSRSYDRKYSSDYKYRKDKSRSDRSRRSRSRSRASRRSRSRSSSYRSRRSSETSSRSRRKRSRSPYHSRSSRRSRSRSNNKSSKTR
ncbi:hypothetical protein HHI36_016620 [Cryptolaemus montrouzieri]|uniref:Arginine/serine-rich protein PNISR-like n=1 Tax=Cryptolaemus montrouzieri TaxID=559131 RepID=A0ABD2NK17_9CUCU